MTFDALRLTAHVLAKQIWENRLDPDLYDWARREARQDGASSPLAWAENLRRAVTGLGSVDDDDFAACFGSSCLAAGLPVRLRLDTRVPLRPRVYVDVRMDQHDAWLGSRTTGPDAERPEHWVTFASEGMYDRVGETEIVEVVR